jgi:hypothetical protein
MTADRTKSRSMKSSESQSKKTPVTEPIRRSSRTDLRFERYPLSWTPDKKTSSKAKRWLSFGDEVRLPFDSIDTSDVIGHGDKALLATLAYTCSRTGAVVTLTIVLKVKSSESI